MSTDDVLKIVADFAPMVLTIVGSTLAVLISTASALMRMAWNAHKKRIQSLVCSIEALSEAVKNAEDQNEVELKKIWDGMQGLRAEVALASRNSDHLKSGLYKVEGALENHRVTLYQHIERLGKLDSKLDAVFRFIDAPRRATEAL